MIQTRPAKRDTLSQQTVRDQIGIEDTGVRSPRWQRIALLFTGLLATVAVLRWWTRVDPPSFLTESLVVEDLLREVTATGTLEPLRRVEVGSELSGIISHVYVDYNDRVEAGQVLAMLDTEIQESQVRRSEASLAGARARVEEAKAAVTEFRAQLKRQRDLQESSGGRLPSGREMDAAVSSLARARAQCLVAEADVQLAEANLKLERTNLERAILYSPIRGVVLDRIVEDGQTIAAALQTPVLFVLAEDLASMELLVDIDEADVGLVRAGQPASFRVDAFPGVDFPAELVQVRLASDASDGVVTYKCVLRVENPELRLRPGMTATARIVVAEVAGELLASNRALRYSPPGIVRSGPGAGVFRLNAAGQPEEVQVTTGLSDGLRTAIRSPELTPGDLILIGTKEVSK